MKYTIDYYKTDTGCPVKEFIDSLPSKLKAKVFHDISLLKVSGYLLTGPTSKYLKGTSGLYELRTIQSNNIVRVFYFFFMEDKIVLTNGFIKKTNKTPVREIMRAERYKKDYLRRHTNG